MLHALVVAAEVRPSPVGDEPMTLAVLRLYDGTERAVAVLGGPTGRGGFSRLYGHVVPVLGARVRIDLLEEPLDRTSLSWAKGGATWPATSLPAAFLLALPPSRDLGLEAGAELDVAARSWSTVSCTAFRAVYAGTTSAPAGDDGQNVVYWHDDVWPALLTPNAVAQTVLHTDANGALRDTDIHINGADYKWALQGAGAVPDARAILVHELGHALGLGHSTVATATMFATYPSGIAWRSLEPDDRDGVCALYPGKGAPGCDAVPCPTAFVCVAGSCERKGAQDVVCAPCERKPGACAGAGDDARCVDVGSPSLGRVCGRACAADADCGKGFHCLPTTPSGDLQCNSDDRCASGPDACKNDVDCAVGACKGGACLGAAAADDAGPDTGADAGSALAGGAGCSCDAGANPARSEAPFAAVALALLAIVRRRRAADVIGRKP